MGENSKIEWTDHTFNPWMGCTKVSEGCKNCYAERDMDHRFSKVQWGPGKPRVRTGAANWKKPLQWNAEAKKTGVRPRVFSASLGDWLDPEVPVEWLADFLALIQATPDLDWLLLTKRPERFGERMNAVFNVEILGNPNGAPGRLQSPWEWFHCKKAPANVWLGTTVENQKAADERIPALMSIPARVRFLSCEPMCGAVDLTMVPRPDHAYMTAQGRTGCITEITEPDDYLYWAKKLIHWVICGGESGPNARPMHPDWARSLRDQCQKTRVPFFFKQWGEFASYGSNSGLNGTDYTVLNDGAVYVSAGLDYPQLEQKHKAKFQRCRPVMMCRCGKKGAGRLLDGREWNELPEVVA